MLDCPTLREMGVTTLEDVINYRVRREYHADVLKIYYKRPQGSLLARSKKFTFVRPRQSMPLEYRGKVEGTELEDVNPMLERALAELKQLVTAEVREEPLTPKAQLLSDLAHLEKVMQAKLGELRQQIEALK